MSCKPYALVALWTDTIPPPGNQSKAHLLMKQQIDEKVLTIEEEQVTITVASPAHTNLSGNSGDPSPQSNPVPPPPSDPYHMGQISSSDLDLRDDMIPALPPAGRSQESVEMAAVPAVGGADGASATSPNHDTSKSLGIRDKLSLSRHKHQNTEVSFRTQRANNLKRRYAAYKYEYEDVDPMDFEYCDYSYLWMKFKVWSSALGVTVVPCDMVCHFL